jgi:hypothetical protein
VRPYLDFHREFTHVELTLTQKAHRELDPVRPRRRGAM